MTAPQVLQKLEIGHKRTSRKTQILTNEEAKTERRDTKNLNFSNYEHEK